MKRNGGFVFVGMSGGAFLVALLVVLAAGAALTMLWVSGKEEVPPEEKAAPEEASPWAETDAVLGDRGPRRREDPRPAMARHGMTEAKDERARLEAEERHLRATAESRARDVSQLRADIAAAELRLERLKAEVRADPNDEEAKDRLYSAVLKLEGGDGRTGLRSRMVRAEADLAEARAQVEQLHDKLNALDSDIARGASEATRVSSVAGYAAGMEAAQRGTAALGSVRGLGDTLEREATEAAAAAAGKKVRRDAALDRILEEP